MRVSAVEADPFAPLFSSPPPAPRSPSPMDELFGSGHASAPLGGSGTRWSDEWTHEEPEPPSELAPPPPPPVSLPAQWDETRECATCGRTLGRSAFSNTQWRKLGALRCKECSKHRIY